MVKRVQLEPVGQYFSRPKADVEFIPTGSALLDCVIGGGWARGRVGNIIGDKSTGKSLLMIEAAANFIHKHPDGIVHYRETESAFSESYAGALGFPLSRVDFGAGIGKGRRKAEPIRVVQELFKDLRRVLDSTKKPTLYILDSLDAISDAAELDRVEAIMKADAAGTSDDKAKGSYGVGKAKGMSELFRNIVQDIEDVGLTWLIVSQIRDNLTARFGDKTRRSGGRALDFYASQVVKLAHIAELKETRSKIERVTGVRVALKCTKNKVALPLRKCEFEILFGFGIDDLACSLEWLKEVDKLDQIKWNGSNLSSKGALGKYIDEAFKMDSAGLRQRTAEVSPVVQRVWYEIEAMFLPAQSKYA